MIVNLKTENKSSRLKLTSPLWALQKNDIGVVQQRSIALPRGMLTNLFLFILAVLVREGVECKVWPECSQTSVWLESQMQTSQRASPWKDLKPSLWILMFLHYRVFQLPLWILHWVCFLLTLACHAIQEYFAIKTNIKWHLNQQFKLRASTLQSAQIIRGKNVPLQDIQGTHWQYIHLSHFQIDLFEKYLKSRRQRFLSWTCICFLN